MSVLSNRDIIRLVAQGTLGITPFDEAQVNASSYDLRLSDRFLEQRLRKGLLYLSLVNAATDLVTTEYHCNDYLLYPGESVLAYTVEEVRLPAHIAATVHAKSSWGRLFIELTSSAGWFDAGFHSGGVLEVHNDNSFAVMLEAGMCIGQLVFQSLVTPADPIYQGHYQAQGGFAVERWHQALARIAAGKRYTATP